MNTIETQSDSSLQRVVRPQTTEIVYTWTDGRQEVRYRRSYDSAEALQLIGEVCDLQVKHGAACPYSYRNVA